jgi:hypothetical protein
LTKISENTHQNIVRYKHQYTTAAVEGNKSYSIAPLNVAKLENDQLIPFQNTKKTIIEHDSFVLVEAFKKPKPAVPQLRVGMSVNDGYKKAIRILVEIQKNEQEIQEMLQHEINI